MIWDIGQSFLSLDPLAMEFPAWSDYNYVLGNPIKLVDLNGKTPSDPPTKTVKITIRGSVFKEGDRTIAIQQHTQVVETTFNDDGSNTVTTTNTEMFGEITTFDFQNNVLTAETKTEVWSFDHDSSGKVTGTNHDLGEWKDFNKDNIKEMGIEGRAVIEGHMKELNANGWNNIMLTDGATKKSLKQLDAFNDVVGALGVVEPVSSVTSALTGALAEALDEHHKRDDAGFFYKKEIEYEEE